MIITGPGVHAVIVSLAMEDLLCLDRGGNATLLPPGGRVCKIKVISEEILHILQVHLHVCTVQVIIKHYLPKLIPIKNILDLTQIYFNISLISLLSLMFFLRLKKKKFCQKDKIKCSNSQFIKY